MRRLSNSILERSRLSSPPIALQRSNLLLGALGAADFDFVLSRLEPIVLSERLVLHEPNTPIEFVYFPVSGAVSLIVVSPEGHVEAASIGREGFVGAPALLYGDSMLTRALVQSPGQAYRMTAANFRSFVEESPNARQLFSRYVLSLINQAAQSVACNRVHSLESRCARWLLMMHDRAEGDELRITQEYLSYMLGVHRPAVTLAAGQLHKAGFIDYSRGKIRIANRIGLESAACVCYRAVRANHESLLGPDITAV